MYLLCRCGRRRTPSATPLPVAYRQQQSGWPPLPDCILDGRTTSRRSSSAAVISLLYCSARVMRCCRRPAVHGRLLDGHTPSSFYSLLFIPAASHSAPAATAHSLRLLAAFPPTPIGRQPLRCSDSLCPVLLPLRSAHGGRVTGIVARPTVVSGKGRVCVQRLCRLFCKLSLLFILDAVSPCSSTNP
jgi:hypothetical protein